MLEQLGSKQVPVIAIFPAEDASHPIILRGGYTQEMLLDALEKAGPSKRPHLTVARATDPNSAKSEFFINVADNPMLDTTEEKWGYAVFGRVIEGMDVVDAIHRLPTRTRGTRDFMPEEPLPTILRAFSLHHSDWEAMDSTATGS